MSNLSDFLGGSPKKWVAGNYDEGKVVWSPSDFQNYMRKTTGASATDPASDLTNWQPTGRRARKSLQRGVITIPNGVASATATISSVNTGKTLVFGTGQTTANTTTDWLAHLVLTNGTTITATRTNNGAYTTSIPWQAEEEY